MPEMTDIDGLAGVKKAKPAKQPKRRSKIVVPEDDPNSNEEFEQSKEWGPQERVAAAQPIDSRTGREAIPSDIAGKPAFEKPANPYAPTGWRKKQRVEFDLELPSGQLCRVMRLERDDLLRLNLMQNLDTFTPMLMSDSLTDEEKNAQAISIVKEDPEALKKMLAAMDTVVLAATVAPKITQDRNQVNYGTESDWNNPNFVATVHLDDIDTFERMFIFGAAFGKSMDELKSILEQADSLASLADVTGLPQESQ